MYPHLIEVHDCRDGGLITLHIAAISSFYTYEGKVHINMISNDDWMVSETYDEIKALIHDAGCIIAKKDPRLDDSPLTMDDLKGMIGEPVWNSNSRKWMLVTDCDYNGSGCAVFEGLGQFETFYPDTLMKFPLYRMKVKDEPESLPF